MSPQGGKRGRGIRTQDVRARGLGERVVTYSFEGETRDKDTGLILPNCDVFLFTEANVLVAQTTSNGSGYYVFTGLPNTTTEYWARAYLIGTPDMAGTTLNNLVAT